MPRLVQRELATAGKLDGSHQAETLVADGPAELDTLLLELFDGGVDVVTHQVELMVITAIRRVSGQFGGGQREDEPAVSGIDRRELEHISEEGANSFGVLGEDDRVRSSDHASIDARAPAAVEERRKE